MRSVVLLLVLTAFAGCADSQDKADVAAGPDEVPPGVLRGVVVDPAIQPIAGARVLLEPGSLENHTGTEGNFEFTDLEPGTYTLRVSREGFLDETVIAPVREGSNPVVKVVMPVDSDALAYVTPYHFKGFVECAASPINWCAQINIASIILCEGYGTCLGNITNDRSLALHWLDGIPDFLQTEMVWDAGNSLGEKFLFVIGAGTREEIATGFVDAFNATRGPSPLMMRADNQTLEEHSVGGVRALMTQVHPSPQEEIPGGCAIYNPCGPSVHLMQDYEFFTHAFYNYKPPHDWRFAEHGPPPAPSQ